MIVCSLRGPERIAADGGDDDGTNPVLSLRGERLALAAVLLLAAGLRVTACLAWPEELSRDRDAYRGLAERLVAGEGYVAPGGPPTAYRPPLYPILLAGVLWAGPAGVALLQVALGVGTVALMVSAGRRLGLGSWALAAATLVAVDPLLLRYTPQAMTEVTCTFLAVLLLWVAKGATDVEATSLPSATLPRERGGQTLAPFLLGVVFGLAVLSRPTFWAFGVLAAGTWAWNWLRGGDRSRRIRRGALVVFGTALVVSPWAGRNLVVFGEPIVTTTHGGYTLLLANNPVYWREVVAGSDAAWEGASLDTWQRSLEREMAGDRVPPDEVARDRWMRGRAVENIRAEPAMFIRSMVYRVGRFWAVTPVTGGASPPVRWGVAVFYVINYVLAAAGVAGLIWRRGQIEGKGSQTSPQRAVYWGPVLLLILVFTAVHAVYWTDSRMRAPLVPAIALLAGNGAAGVSKRAFCRRKPLGT